MKNQNRGRNILAFIPKIFRLQVIKLLVVIFCAVLFETACFDSNQKENAAQTGNSVLPNSPINQNPTKEINALCENPFYPTNAARKREYRVEGGSPAAYVLTQAAGGSDSFVETRSFSTGERSETTWECTAEGLRNTEYTSFIPTPGGAVEMKTANSSGVTLPKNDWKTGKKWTTQYVAKVKMTYKVVEGLFLQIIKVDNVIKSPGQKIKVSGGEFEAAQIDSTIQMDLPTRENSAVKIKSSAWYSPQIGLVKQTIESPFGKMSIEYSGEK